MKWTVAAFAAAGALLCTSATAQEINLNAGSLASSGQHSYSWSLDYFEGLGPYFEGSLSWINEGHIPDHHRDGPTAQVWARLPLDDKHIELAAGVGPYYYFDTTAAEQNLGYWNTHGWGAVYSVRATYYSTHRWTANLQLNRVQVSRGPWTTSVLMGIGYQLDAPDGSGARDWALPRTQKVTNNEVTLMAGETILNSLQSQTSWAEALEYRRGLTNYLDATVGYLHEGNGITARRDGVTSQLWLTRAFLDNRLTIAAGAGVYVALHQGAHADERPTGDGIVSGLFSLSGSYRLTDHWSARVTWDRVVTRYSRDTDVLLGGVGYRF